jgi:RNA recognition motif-containing protein
MNIYVGNLAREVNDEDLKTAFSAFGQVASAAVIKDKFTGESRGFGFVEMPDKTQAQAAMTGLNGTELKGSALSVNEARPRPEGGAGGGRSGGGRPGGGGGARFGGGGRPGGGGGSRPGGSGGGRGFGR